MPLLTSLLVKKVKSMKTSTSHQYIIRQLTPCLVSSSAIECWPELKVLTLFQLDFAYDKLRIFLLYRCLMNVHVVCTASQITHMHANLLSLGLDISVSITTDCKVAVAAYIHSELRITCRVTNIYSKPVTNRATPSTVTATK